MILEIHAPENVLRERLLHRADQTHEASEAGLAVLDHQLASLEPLTADEKADALAIDGVASGVPEIVQTLRTRLGTV